jgi:hypothetical protein
MARRPICKACGDPIEEDWWTKVEYMMEAGQIALAARYCEDCGREVILGRLESPRSEQQRWFRAAPSQKKDEVASENSSEE